MIQTQQVGINYTTQTQGTPDDAGSDEVQKIAFSSVPDTGSFVLNFNGQVTGNIPFNATASQIETSLNLLPALGGVAVTGDFANGFQITFAGSNGLTNQPTLLLQNSTLFTNTIAITATPCTVTEGQYPAQNLKNVSNVSVAINSVKLSDATNPEPNWFAGQVVC
jgi:hypothetical protein